MGDPALSDTMERFDPLAARWRLQAYTRAAECSLEGLGERRAVRVLNRELLMPLADAEDVVARVRG